MVFGKAFLLELLLLGRHRAGHIGPHGHGSGRRNTIQVAGDELQSRIVKSSAAVISESDPAVEVGGFVVTGNGQDVVGVPGQIGGQIGSFDLVLARAGIVQRHEQGGTVEQIGGNFRESIALGVDAGDNIVANFPDRAVIVGEQSGLYFFALGGAVVLVSANQSDFLADIFVQEFGGFEQVVFVVLLDDAEFVRLAEGAEMDGCGIDGGGDVHELQPERAGGKQKLANVADQSDIGVVNGNGEIGLIVEAGGLAGGGLPGVLFWRTTLPAVRGGIEPTGAKQSAKSGGGKPWQTGAELAAGSLHRIDLFSFSNLLPWLERGHGNFLQG